MQSYSQKLGLTYVLANFKNTDRKDQSSENI